MNAAVSVIVCLLALLCGVKAEYGDRIKNATVTWGDNLDMEESRHNAYAVAVPSPRTELPITFQAPFINARDYWSEPRRTVLDYQPYVSQDLITRPINTFYGLMQHFFGTEIPRRPLNAGTPQKHQPYEVPYYQQLPAKPYYLPGPKPLRASIQKLEPLHTPEHFPSPTQMPYNNYPKFVKILNDVLTENTLKYQESPVLEKPNYGFEPLIPTTYKPRTNAYKHRTTTYKPQPFPESIQDQLPPVPQGQNTRIPYATEITTEQSTELTTGARVIFPEQAEDISPLDYAIDVRNAEKTVTRRPEALAAPLTPLTHLKGSQEPTTPAPIESVEVTTNGESGIKVVPVLTKEENTTTTKTPVEDTTPSDKSGIQVIPTTNVMEIGEATTASHVTQEKPIFQESDNSVPAASSTIETTSLRPYLQTQQSEEKLLVSELLSTVEPIESTRFRGPFPKKLYSRKVTTDSTQSVDYVTDLTLKGLTDTKAVHVNVPNYTTNMSSVIDYIVEKLNGTALSPKVIPIDDELSLDAKILKDTNWDGFQPTVTSTTDFAVETTLSPTTEPTTEVVPGTLPPTTTEPSSEEKQTVVIATRMTKSISRTIKQRQRAGTTTERSGGHFTRALITTDTPQDVAISDIVTEHPTTSQQSRRGRKYQRRPRVQNFNKVANKSTGKEPLRTVLVSRSSQRERSNGNTTRTYETHEKIYKNNSAENKTLNAASNEGIIARRNFYRRRKHPSQIKEEN